MVYFLYIKNGSAVKQVPKPGLSGVRCATRLVDEKACVRI